MSVHKFCLFLPEKMTSWEHLADRVKLAIEDVRYHQCSCKGCVHNKLYNSLMLELASRMVEEPVNRKKEVLESMKYLSHGMRKEYFLKCNNENCSECTKFLSCSWCSVSPIPHLFEVLHDYDVTCTLPGVIHPRRSRTMSI